MADAIQRNEGQEQSLEIPSSSEASESSSVSEASDSSSVNEASEVESSIEESEVDSSSEESEVESSSAVSELPSSSESPEVDEDCEILEATSSDLHVTELSEVESSSEDIEATSSSADSESTSSSQDSVDDQSVLEESSSESGEDSEAEFHDGVRNETEFDDQPIYESPKISKGQVVCLLLSFFLRHRLSIAALRDLLQLINLLIPNCLPKTKYLLAKFLGWERNVTEHFYCTKCSEYLYSYQKECHVCESKFDIGRNRKKGFFFLVSSIRKQLKDMLESRDLWSHVLKAKMRPRDPECKSDVTTGDAYKNNAVLSDFIKSGRNLSITFSADGIKPQNNSKNTLWPVFCTVNELDVHDKEKFMIMSTLWFGSHKPDMNTVMIPFVDEMNSLFSEGVDWVAKDGEQHVTKVVPLIAVCDSPARCALLQLKQYNGKNGCTCCLHPGVRLQNEKTGQVTCYPVLDSTPRLRTHNETLELARDAVKQGVPICGVKGITRLFFLPFFDVIVGAIVDSMHACWLGVTKQFMSIFLKPSKGNYYIGRDLAEIDRILLSAKPTNEIPRVPRSITQRALFKASENREFVLFYSAVVLEGLLPPLYFRHWLLFVNSMRMLFVEEIPPENRRIAKIFLQKFVSDIPKLYGPEQMTYNVHLLTHLVDNVESWGAPWSYSAFIFEHFGGCLAKGYHGTTQLPNQMMDNFHAFQNLLSFSCNRIPNAEESVKKFFEKMGFSITSVEPESPVFTKGRGRVVALGTLEIAAIEALFDRPLLCNCAIEYYRITVVRKVYSTASYDSKFSRCNSLFSAEDGSCFELKKIFQLTDQCTCRLHNKPCVLRDIFKSKALAPDTSTIMLADQLPLISDSDIDPDTGVDLTKFLTYVDPTVPSLLVAMSPQNIKYKWIPIVKGEKRYVIINDLQFERG
jgi:Transposase family tnp2